MDDHAVSSVSISAAAAEEPKKVLVLGHGWRMWEQADYQPRCSPLPPDEWAALVQDRARRPHLTFLDFDPEERPDIVADAGEDADEEDATGWARLLEERRLQHSFDLVVDAISPLARHVRCSPRYWEGVRRALKPDTGTYVGWADRGPLSDAECRRKTVRLSAAGDDIDAHRATLRALL